MLQSRVEHLPIAKPPLLKSRETGRKVFAFQADVTKSDDVAKLVADAEKSLGKIDILINNAGINLRGMSLDLAESDWDAVIAVNLKAPFLCTHRRAGNVQPRLGAHFNIGVNSVRDRISGPGAVCIGESGRCQSHARAGAGICDAGCDGQCDLSRPVCDGHEQAAAERSGKIQSVRRKNSDGPLGQIARDRRGCDFSCIRCCIICDRQHVVRRWRLDGAVSL